MPCSPFIPYCVLVNRTLRPLLQKGRAVNKTTIIPRSFRVLGLKRREMPTEDNAIRRQEFDLQGTYSFAVFEYRDRRWFSLLRPRMVSVDTSAHY
jgi:hypothetical protein